MIDPGATADAPLAAFTTTCAPDIAAPIAVRRIVLSKLLIPLPHRPLSFLRTVERVSANPAASSAIVWYLFAFRRIGGLLESAREVEEGVLIRGDGIAQEIGESAVTAHVPGEGD
jgi:hypothetical protein